MAAAPGLLLWLLLLGPPGRVRGQQDPGPGRRFSEHKLCADDECSMLMYRGEALEDFTGPDCRFVNFKKGDPVYVYYKLEGKWPELWAGSVGRTFGYFPKDLIQVVHKYTKEELQVPADETDFVCFDGGRDDFDNYNVEELLGFLELHDSTTGESEKDLEKTSQHVGKSPEVSEENGPEPELEEFNSEESESLFLETTKELKGRHEGQIKQPHINSQTYHAQGERSAFEPFEEILHDQLKVPETENNKTNNSSLVSTEQEKIDAYKLLKKEMSLDLKTKFGSTADALVSDDETTRLVTSLEDDFDEELDAEYYAVGKEEEESQEDFDELPLLTFTHGEDRETPGKPGFEKYSADKEQNPSQGNVVGEIQPPGIKNDPQHIITVWEDTILTAAAEGKDKNGVDSERSNTEEGKEGAEVLVPENKQGTLSSTREDNNPEKAGDELLVADISKTDNDKEPEVNTEIHTEGKEKKVEPKSSLGKDETEAEKQGDVTVSGLSQSSSRNFLPTAAKGKEILKSEPDNKDDPQIAVVQISKEMFREEKLGEQTLGGISESKSAPKATAAPKATGKQLEPEKVKQESMGLVPVGGDNQHNTSQDLVQEVTVAGSGHPLAVEHPGEAFKEERLLQTANQPQFSSPDEVSLPRELEEEVPIWARNLTRQQEGDVDAAAGGTAGDTVGTGIPGLSPEEPGAAAEEAPEELLEDENALSAKQAQVKPPKVHDSLLAINLQDPRRGPLGAVITDPESEELKETSTILESERKSKTGDKGTELLGRGLGSMVAEKKSPPVDEEAQGPPDISDSPEVKKNRTPGLGEMFQGLQEDNPEALPETSELAQKTGPELSKENQKDSEGKLTGPERQGSASEEHKEDLTRWTSRTAAAPEHSDHIKDLPIISSFFKDQQSLQRFQKYFDVLELEAMLQEMSLKLKAAQQDSLPYNVDKVLDKVFRASESHILSVAEKMLDTRVMENGDLGMKESTIFEEAAVLDDIQDLIYFVRHKQSTVEVTAPLATRLPWGDDWGESMEELQPPLEDNVPHDKTEDLDMQVSQEPSHWDQSVTSDPGISEVSQKPSTETEVDPGVIRTEAIPVIDAKEKPEVNAEEPAGGTSFENSVPLFSSLIFYLTKMLVAKLPEDVQPGPNFYGLPWQPVLITAFLGIVSFSVFFWRTVLAVKSRVYQVTEQQIAEKVKNIMKENIKLLQKLSDYEQKIKESKEHVQEFKKENTVLSDEAVKFKYKIKKLEESRDALDDTAKNLQEMLESEREQNVKNQNLIVENKKSIEKLKDIIAMNASELSEVQIALNEKKLSEEKVKSECLKVQEENAKLKKKKKQLQQEIKDWTKSHSELSEQMKSLEKSQKDLEITLANKDDNINALTNCIKDLTLLDDKSEPEGQSNGENNSDEMANGEVAGDRNEKLNVQIKQLLDVSRTKTAISVLEEDLKRLQCELRASMSTKCDLEIKLKELEDNCNSLQSTKVGLEDECRTLKQKVEILHELYQQKEMALQKKLSQEEYERQEKEQQLSTADEKAVLAAEKLKTYKRRIEELEEELRKTERSFKNEIATQEKKAHENWLKARAAERAMNEEKRESANLRHKLLELTEKMAMLQEEPVIVKPMPGRPTAQNPRRGPLSRNGSFGPSPVSGGECSPPLTADSPARPLSATLGRREMPPGEFDPRSGAPPMMNSNSRSSSPNKVLDEGKQTVSQESEGRSVPSISSLAEHPVAVNMAPRGPPPFPGPVPFMGGPIPPPPMRYGPPPPFFGPFGPRPIPPPLGPGLRPPLGPREYVPGIPPGRLPFDPREFVPGHVPFRPVGPPGPREYFIPGPRVPPPPHGPLDYPPPPFGHQDYPPPPAARDLLPSGSRDEPPPASRSSQDGSQALKQPVNSDV